MPKGNHCCVPFCTSDRRKGHGLLFHSFPGSNVTNLAWRTPPGESRGEASEVRVKWIHAIRRDEVKGVFVVQPYDTVVCSEHFRDADYVQGTKKPGARLKQTAIPTIFSWTQLELRSGHALQKAAASGRSPWWQPVKAAERT